MKFNSIFNLISPFIAAFLTYILLIKGKKKDIDLEGKKELNTIISNLLNIWHYLTRIDSVIGIISEKEMKTLYPKRYLPNILLNTGLLKDGCFREFEESNNLLKKYDPITYYRLEGLGQGQEVLNKNYIMPFFSNSKLDIEVISASRPLLKRMLSDVEDGLYIVAERISKNMVKEVKSFILKNSKIDTKESIEELDLTYYEMMMDVLPKEIEIPSFEEFKNLIENDEEFRKIQEVQMEIALGNGLNEYLDIISRNPNISMEDLSKEISEINNKKK